MYRKFLAASVALVIVGGAVFAEEISAIFVKYADGKITVKVDDKEKTYDVDKDAKVKVGKGQKEVSLPEAIERFKEGSKVKLTVENNKVVKARRERGK
jgi:hypothetical protein